MNNNFIFSGIAIALIFLSAFFGYFGSKPKLALAEADVPTVIMIQKSGYQPSLIQIPAGKTVSLHFLRNDLSACASSVIFTQLNYAYQLSLNKVTNIVLPPQKSGEIDFTCEVGSYHGKILVV